MYSLYVLNEIEKKYCIHHGKLISDYFDIICGCSVGSIIAIAIALKMPMSDTIQIFENDISKIFPIETKSNGFCSTIVNWWYTFKQLIGCKYDSTKLKTLKNNILTVVR